MNNANVHREMLINVAVALGTELCQKMVFVGGCTTSLLLTDAFTKEQVRHTDDVDLIIHVLGLLPYYELQEELRLRNFKENPDVDDPICAMKLGDLRVDFMPDDESILGFSNRWYREAFAWEQLRDDASCLTISMKELPNQLGNSDCNNYFSYKLECEE